MKRKIALYDPYLDTLGGGEKHILSILKALEDEKTEINIFWDQNLNQEIESKLNIYFKNPPKYLLNIFNPSMSSRARNERGDPVANNRSPILTGLLRLRHLTDPRNDIFNKLATLHKYDFFFYVTDGSYFFSTAKRNFVFCMVPKKDLYTRTLLNRIKSINYKFITNSYFTNVWLRRFGIKGKVIYPYLDHEFISLTIDSEKKDKIILSVGRFFKQLHAKRQDKMIDLFKKIQHKYSLFKDFKLILAGGLKKEDQSYFEELKQKIKNDSSILLLPNLPHQKLIDLYKKALIYWHFTGFDVDEKENPELVEHLGIAPLEAMASGCITYCVNAGGPKEIIKNGTTGFLFESENDLINKMRLALSNAALSKDIQKQAKEFVVNNFNYKTFKKRVKEVIL